MALIKRGKYWHIKLYDPDNLLSASKNGVFRRTTFLTSKEHAKTIHNEMELALSRLRMGLPSGLQAKVDPISLSSLKTRYLEYAVPRKEATTIDLDTLVINRLITLYGGEQLTTHVNALNVQNYLLSETLYSSNKHLSKSSINIYMRHLSAIWTWVVKNNLSQSNSFRDVKKLKVDKSLRRPFSNVELQALFKAIDNKTIYNIVIFALLTGMRRSEIVNLTPSDVDMKNHLIYVRKRKDDEPLTIPILPMIGLLIKDRLGSERIFPVKPAALTYHFRKYVKKAKLPKELTFHSLRHTVPTVLFQKGATAQKIQHLLRHSDLKMTEHYIQFTEKDLLEPMTIMEDFVREITRG